MCFVCCCAVVFCVFVLFHLCVEKQTKTNAKNTKDKTSKMCQPLKAIKPPSGTDIGHVLCVCVFKCLLCFLVVLFCILDDFCVFSKLIAQIIENIKTQEQKKLTTQTKQH